jgi:hypothetical protein
MVECVAGVEVVELLGKTGKGSVQCPDLFVFSKDHKEWCFVEVKGPNDYVRPGQEEVFDDLRRRTGGRLYVAKIRLVDP